MSQQQLKRLNLIIKNFTIWIFIGTFYLYKNDNKVFESPNYKCNTGEDAMYFIPKCYWIRHENSDELYTATSILKIKDITEEEWLSYTRNKQLDKIL